MSFFGDVLSFGGSMAGGLFSSAVEYGFSKKLQAAAQAFQKEVLQSRHQWEVDDLRAAGLNPILSAQYGGGSAAGGIPTSPKVENPVLTHATAGKMIAEKKLTEAITKKTEHEATTAKGIAEQTDIETERKKRGFVTVDEGVTPFARKALDYVEDMPKYLRGPFRMGIGTGDQLYQTVRDMYEAAKAYKKQKDYERELRDSKRFKGNKIKWKYNKKGEKIGRWLNGKYIPVLGKFQD